MATLPVTFALEPRFKEQFATFMQQGFTPFVAAARIWPHDAGLASQVALVWPDDEYVVAFREKLKQDDAAKLLPATKSAQIKRIEAKLTGMTDDNYIKAERLIADMSGFIEKAAPPTVNVDARNQTIDKVLVYRDSGDDAMWQAKLVAQQRKLELDNTDV